MYRQCNQVELLALALGDEGISDDDDAIGRHNAVFFFFHGGDSHVRPSPTQDVDEDDRLHLLGPVRHRHQHFLRLLRRIHRGGRKPD